MTLRAVITILIMPFASVLYHDKLTQFMVRLGAQPDRAAGDAGILVFVTILALGLTYWTRKENR